jgi:hypothetical protein
MLGSAEGFVTPPPTPRGDNRMPPGAPGPRDTEARQAAMQLRELRNLSDTVAGALSSASEELETRFTEMVLLTQKVPARASKIIIGALHGDINKKRDEIRALQAHERSLAQQGTRLIEGM